MAVMVICGSFQGPPRGVHPTILLYMTPQSKKWFKYFAKELTLAMTLMATA